MWWRGYLPDCVGEGEWSLGERPIVAMLLILLVSTALIMMNYTHIIDVGINTINLGAAVLLEAAACGYMHIRRRARSRFELRGVPPPPKAGKDIQEEGDLSSGGGTRVVIVDRIFKVFLYYELHDTVPVF